MKKKLNLPHSEGNGSLGDLLSANSVPRIKPVPRICRERKLTLCFSHAFKIDVYDSFTANYYMIGSFR